MKWTDFEKKLVPFLLSVTNTRGWTNTLAYYGIRTLRILNVFIIRAPGVGIIKLITGVIYGFDNKLECLPLAGLSSLV